MDTFRSEITAEEGGKAWDQGRASEALTLGPKFKRMPRNKAINLSKFKTIKI